MCRYFEHRARARFSRVRTFLLLRPLECITRYSRYYILNLCVYKANELHLQQACHFRELSARYQMDGRPAAAGYFRHRANWQWLQGVQFTRIYSLLPWQLQSSSYGN